MPMNAPLTRSSWGLAPFIKQHLAPNRIVVYLTAFVALATALSPLFVEYDLAGVAAVLGAVAAFASVIVKWLSGWQQFEKAQYQLHLATLGEAAERERLGLMNAQATASASTPRVKLPR